jgi:hypothetical protein
LSFSPLLPFMAYRTYRPQSRLRPPNTRTSKYHPISSAADRDSTEEGGPLRKQNSKEQYKKLNACRLALIFCCCRRLISSGFWWFIWLGFLDTFLHLARVKKRVGSVWVKVPDLHHSYHYFFSALSALQQLNMQWVGLCPEDDFVFSCKAAVAQVLDTFCLWLKLLTCLWCQSLFVGLAL